jgi:hypothetical protein
MVDTVTPNFRALIAKGAIINNPLSISRVEHFPPVATPYRRVMLRVISGSNLSGWNWSGTQALPETVLGSWLDPSSDPAFTSMLSSLSDQAVTRAHANASSAEISALMVAGEAHKTVASMASIMKRVWSMARAAKRLDLAYLRKQISRKELEDRYMELRYAIRPLMYDAAGAQAALEESRLYTTMRQTYRGFAKDTYSKSDTIAMGSMWECNGTVTRTVKCNVTARAGVLTTVKTSGSSIWGMDQFLETAWEVIPFSFIIDWFFDIGNKIAAFAPSAGVEELASWVTVDVDVTKTNSLATIQNNSSYLTSHTNVMSWSGSNIRKEFIRTRSVNPSLSFVPNLKIRLDPLKLLDLTIILKKFL